MQVAVSGLLEMLVSRLKSDDGTAETVRLNVTAVSSSTTKDLCVDLFCKVFCYYVPPSVSAGRKVATATNM